MEEIEDVHHGGGGHTAWQDSEEDVSWVPPSGQTGALPNPVAPILVSLASQERNKRLALSGGSGLGFRV
jgi:hypothetical protein